MNGGYLSIFASSVVFTLTLSYVAKHPNRARLAKFGAIASVIFALGAGVILVSA